MKGAVIHVLGDCVQSAGVALVSSGKHGGTLTRQCGKPKAGDDSMPGQDSRAGLSGSGLDPDQGRPRQDMATTGSTATACVPDTEPSSFTFRQLHAACRVVDDELTTRQSAPFCSARAPLQSDLSCSFSGGCVQSDCVLCAVNQVQGGSSQEPKASSLAVTVLQGGRVSWQALTSASSEPPAVAEDVCRLLPDASCYLLRCSLGSPFSLVCGASVLQCFSASQLDLCQV